MHHRGALVAAVRETYRLGVRDVPVLELPDLTGHLPPGGGLWRALGGPLSITPEMRMLQYIEFRLRVLDWHLIEGKGERPQPPVDPEWTDAAAPQMDKAAAFLRRDARMTGR